MARILLLQTSDKSRQPLPESQVSSIFARNIEILREQNPPIWHWIKNAEPDPRVRLIRTADGYPNLRFQLQQGQTFHYYDMKRPLDEIRRQYHALTYGAGRVTLIFGLGLGYNLAAIEEKLHPDHKVIVVEENPTVLYHALHTVDFSELMRQDRLSIVLPIQEAIDALLMAWAIRIYRRQVNCLFDPSALMVSSEDFRDLINATQKELQHYVVRLRTQFIKCRQMTLNELLNLPYILQAATSAGLENAFAGRPAVVVSAGPSLKKNVHQLLDYQDRVVIIATAPVVRVLRAYDLEPHLVCSLDFSVSNMETLEDVWDRTELPLVFLNRIHPPLLAKFQGRLIATHQDSAAGNWPPWVWEGHPRLAAGGNVGVMALSTAYLLGADPVILIGQDLAFSDGHTHSEGVVGRRSTAQVMTADSEVMLDGLDGRPVVSSPSFASYLAVCQDLIKSQSVTTINATARGARIEHAVEMPLDKALAKYATQPLDARRRIAGISRPAKWDLNQIIDSLRLFLAGAVRARERAQRGLELNRRIRDLLRTPGAEFSRQMDELLAENEDISRKLQAFTVALPLMASYLSKEMNFICQADYVEDVKKVSRAKSLKTGLRRNRLILEATRRAAGDFQRRLPPLIRHFRRLQEAEQILADDPGSFDGHLRQGRALAGIGRQAEAASSFGAAVDNNPASRRARLALARSLVALERYPQARQELEALLEAAPGHRRAVELLARIEAAGEDLSRRAEEAREAKDWVSVMTFARKALTDRPDDPRLEELVAWAREVRAERMSEDQAAMDRLADDRDRRREFEADLDQGRELFQAGRYAEALDPLSRAAAHEDLDEERQAAIMLGCSRGETGDLPGAEAILEAVMAEHPDWLFPRLNLGRIYLRNGRIDEGLDHLSRAAAGSPVYAHHFLEIGDVRFQRGQYAAGLKAYLDCARALPGSFEARYKAGLCQLALGRPQAARRSLGEALRLKPDYGPALLAQDRIDRKLDRQRAGAGEAG
jgi:tetratricopeptide (TPR) repeat protein